MSCDYCRQGADGSYPLLDWVMARVRIEPEGDMHYIHVSAPCPADGTWADAFLPAFHCPGCGRGL